MTNLQAITQEIPAAKTVFKTLADRKRYRRRTDLDRLYRSMNDKLTHEEFMVIFKRLQALGVGSVIIGRKNNPDRFAWNYNLKEFAEVATHSKSKDLNILSPLARKGRGRPPGSKNAPKAIASPVVTAAKESSSAMINVSFSIPASSPKKEIQALLELAQDLNKSFLSPA